MSSLVLLVHYKLFILEKYIKNRITMTLVYIAHSIKLNSIKHVIQREM